MVLNVRAQKYKIIFKESFFSLKIIWTGISSSRFSRWKNIRINCINITGELSFSKSWTFASWKLNFHRLKVELLEAKSSTFGTHLPNYCISNSYKYAQTKVVLHKNTKRPVRLSLFFGINFYSFGMKVFHWKKIVCAHGKIASGKFPFFFCQNKKRLYLCTLKINLYT